jgi:hypothetical protein
MRSALETVLLARRCDSYIEGLLQFGINEFSAIDMVANYRWNLQTGEPGRGGTG